MELLEIKSTVSPWLPVILSFISLSASLVVAYMANFKKSNASVLIGSQITMYPAPYQTPEGILWGGTGIYIPMTFYNWSPNGGSVIECRINIASVNDPNEVFDIGWYEFSEMLQSERRMGYGGAAQPIPLPPKGSLTKTILFTWFPSADKNLAIIPGRYSLNILIWTHSNSKPDIKQSFEFSITEQEAKDYAINLQNRTPFTIDLSIRETNRRNSVLTQDQVNKIYG